MYSYSIQGLLDKWFRKDRDSSEQKKAREQQTSDQTEQKRRKREEQRQWQSKGSAGSRTNKKEDYFFLVLGLAPESTADDIRARYRELVMQYHPDKVAKLGPRLKEVAEDETKKLNEAYDFFKKKYGLQ